MKKPVPNKDHIDNSGRRNFLKQAWKILGLVAAAELGVFIDQFVKTYQGTS